MKIAIVGSGMAGLACARHLHDAGINAVVLDKGRGIGGRMATRRGTAGAQFDHGAQYITAQDEGFADFLAKAEAAGAVAPWEVDFEKKRKLRYVGIPGMTGLAKFMAKGLDVRQSCAVDALLHTDRGWQVDWAGTSELFDTVVCTTPAPQTSALLGKDHTLGPSLAQISYDPCLTLLAQLDRAPNGAADVFTDKEGDLSWVARDSAKPRRSAETECWVAQASPKWSRAHLEMDGPEMTAALCETFCDLMSLPPHHIIEASAHRWRYARVANTLDLPFLQSDDGHFFAGGDGFLGPRVEAAYLSGTAIAKAILDQG